MYVRINTSVCVYYSNKSINASEKANVMNKIQMIRTLLDTNLSVHNALFYLVLICYSAIHSLKPPDCIPFAWKWLIKLYLTASHFLIYLPLLPANSATAEAEAEIRKSNSKTASSCIKLFYILLCCMVVHLWSSNWFPLAEHEIPVHL